MKQKIWIDPGFENDLCILLPVEQYEKKYMQNISGSKSFGKFVLIVKLIQFVQYISYEENKSIFDGIGGILIKAKCVPLSQFYKILLDIEKKIFKHYLSYFCSIHSTDIMNQDVMIFAMCHGGLNGLTSLR